MATIDNRENLQSYAQSGLHLAIVRETIKPGIPPFGVAALRLRAFIVEFVCRFVALRIKKTKNSFVI